MKNITSFDIRSAIAIIGIGIIGTLFLILAKYSNILREETSTGSKNAPFSLTKVQFGIWTVIISSVYIYLSLFKGDCATAGINETALVLMGIFAGTAVASSIMDKNEINDNRPRHQNNPSQGFFVDILSDASGISLHRFQNFTWTLIAMIVYLYKVAQIQTGCDLPELSDTLLALTGISSATYLVLKTKENDPPAQTVAATTAQTVAAQPAAATPAQTA